MSAPILNPWASVQALKQMKIIAERVRSLTDDEEAHRDTMEGLVDLSEVVESLMRQRAQVDAQAVALADYAAEVAGSARKLLTRSDSLKDMILESMLACGQQTYAGVAGSCSIGQSKGAVEIVVEAMVPVELWTKPEPQPDKTAIRKLLLEGKDVPGARLTPPQDVLTIRLKKAKKAVS